MLKRLWTLSILLTSLAINASPLNCDGHNTNSFFSAGSQPKLIEIETKSAKKWAKNYIKALRYPSTMVPEKFKKKFLANIKVSFQNGLKCSFPAKIRIHGDVKDHLDSEPPITSLDVSLKEGNILSITKFKLFLPHTRYGDNEVFTTTFLKQIGFLSPRTFYIDSKFNGKEIKFLFQEKIVKEFLENNLLREAPILEGDERFMNDFNGHKFILSRVSNDNWIKKGKTSAEISERALEELNSAYLNNLIRTYIYDGDDIKYLLPNKKIKVTEEYEYYAFLAAMRSLHAIVPSNRKFYYDPFYNLFRPIYYDGDSDVLNDRIDLFEINKYGTNNNFIIDGTSHALKRLSGLDINVLKENLEKNGIFFSDKKINRVVHNIRIRLQNISLLPRAKENIYPYKKYFAETVSKDSKSWSLVFKSELEDVFEICSIDLEECYSKKLNLEEVSKLLNGRLGDFIYLGNKLNYQNGDLQDSPIVLKQNYLYKELGILKFGSPEIDIIERDRKIVINQNSIKDRVLFRGSKIDGWTINFLNTKTKIKHSSQRFDQNLLTGCLNFLDTKLNKVIINVTNPVCEDGVNFIRTNGSVDSISVSNSFSDAIDGDFSNLFFQDIFVENAGNDCVDFSAGSYEIKNAKLSSCGDKGLSAGEESTVEIEFAQINNSGTALASKDSSRVNVSKIQSLNNKLCFSAYNKKQEFWGGVIKIANHNCLPSEFYKDNSSIISQKNEFQD